MKALHRALAEPEAEDSRSEFEKLLEKPRSTKQADSPGTSALSIEELCRMQDTNAEDYSFRRLAEETELRVRRPPVLGTFVCRQCYGHDPDCPFRSFR